MPVFIGSTTLSTAAAATAASMALPPCCMICSPACAASGWLVVTMACGAITSARLCPPQPSARLPGTAAQAGTSCSAQVESGGAACASAPQGISAAAIVAAAQRALKGVVMNSSPDRMEKLTQNLGTWADRGDGRTTLASR